MKDNLVHFSTGLPTLDIGVDKANLVLRGVKVAQVGPVNDNRPFVFDMQTLEQIVELGNRPNKGRKSRFTHPNEELGTHLGYFMNFRIEGDAVRADLHIAKSSMVSPYGNIGGYVITMAEEDPEVIGASIAAEPDRELMKNESVDGVMPFRLLDLYAVDIVGNPAATRGGLFAVEETMAEEDAKEPKDYSFLESEDMKPEEKIAKVAEMLGYEIPTVEKEEEMSEDEPEKKEEEMSSDPTFYLETFGDRGARWFLEKKGRDECFAIVLEESKKETERLRAELEAMSVKLEAAKNLGGEAEPISQGVESVDPKRAEFSAKIDELKAKGVSERAARWAVGFGSLGSKDA